MAYVRIPDPNFDIDKPLTSADMKRVRDNQDDFDSRIIGLEAITDQDIRDHFMAPALSDTGSNANWVHVNTGGGDVVSLINNNTAKVFLNGNAAARWALLAGSTRRQRVIKSDEYIAIMEVRVKLVGTALNHYTFGWNDDALTTAGAIVDDVSDFVGVILDTGTGNWKTRTSLAAAALESSAYSTATDWNKIRLEFTCSATPGSRKVETYLNGVLTSTLSTDANLPTALLRPIAGCRGDGTGSPDRQMVFNYAQYSWKAVPLAA